MYLSYLSTFGKFSVVVATVLCIGCSTLYGERGVFRGKQTDYLRTGELKPIEVPKGMNSRVLETLYQIPDVDSRDEFGDLVALGEYEVPRPTPINTEKGEVGVKIQKLGEQSWIFLNASTSQVWPRTQNFLSEYGLSVAHSDPASGTIETGDVIFKDDSSKKTRFRITVEKGVHPETSEIHILQKEFSADASIPARIDWPLESNNSARASTLLNELAGILAQNISNNAASLLGQNVGGLPKVEFLQGMQEPTMRIRLFESRAKASVAHALEKESFILWEESVPNGLYYVGYDPEWDDKGFFDRITGDELPQKPEYSLQKVLKHLSASADVKEKFSAVPSASYGEPLEDAIGLIILIEKTENAMDVVVRDVRGEKLPPAQSKQVLRVIRKNLI